MDSMLHAFIFLAAGVIAVPIATRLGLGSVLGYLIAGALIGPSAMGFIDNAERLMHFSEFGVVMMLFLIGLELQPSVLWRMRIPILGLGGLQMLITTAAIGAIAAYGFQQSWENSLAIGLILALSSTAIALQVLSEKNLMKTKSGKSGFAVLLFQDIAVIPIIALLPLLALGVAVNSGTDTSHATESTNLITHLPGWQKAVIVIATVLAIILAGRFLTRPLFRFIAESRLRELFTATALMLVMGIAVLMNMVGLSPALGAFVAGVVLADSEYRHELEANIDPFKTLLLGLFFISVGASINFKLLVTEPSLICAIVVGLVVVKLVILLLLGRLFDLKGGPRYWFAFTLAQGGEFGFVLLSFSLQNKVLPEETVNILTAAIALSMVLTPILVLLNEKIIQPRFQQKENHEISNEEIEDQDDAVIIAGFGRFGQIAGRLLIANDIPVTVLDHSASHIERVRRFGFKIFYGDASREDLLHTAGAHKATLLIIAIDDREKTRKIIEIVKHSYPHLKIFTRAFDAIHYHELKAAGADYIEREMFLSSLKVGEKALEALGMRAYQARRQALRFADHDRAATDRIGQHLDDNTRFISETRLAHEEVLELLRRDRKIQKTSIDHAWDASGHD